MQLVRLGIELSSSTTCNLDRDSSLGSARKGNSVVQKDVFKSLIIPNFEEMHRDSFVRGLVQENGA